MKKHIMALCALIVMGTMPMTAQADDRWERAIDALNNTSRAAREASAAGQAIKGIFRDGEDLSCYLVGTFGGNFSSERCYGTRMLYRESARQDIRDLSTFRSVQRNAEVRAFQYNEKQFYNSLTPGSHVIQNDGRYDRVRTSRPNVYTRRQLSGGGVVCNNNEYWTAGGCQRR